MPGTLLAAMLIPMPVEQQRNAEVGPSFGNDVRRRGRNPVVCRFGGMRYPASWTELAPLQVP